MNEKDYLWVARDKDNCLYLYDDKPLKGEGVWNVSENSLTYTYFKLNPAFFPNVKWEDEEPLAVVLQQAIFKSK